MHISESPPPSYDSLFPQRRSPPPRYDVEAGHHQTRSVRVCPKAYTDLSYRTRMNTHWVLYFTGICMTIIPTIAVFATTQYNDPYNIVDSNTSKDIAIGAFATTALCGLTTLTQYIPAMYFSYKAYINR